MVESQTAPKIMWSELDKTRLTELWASGQPTRAIAEAMETTKNAVIGMAHRMHLTPRPSPILTEMRQTVRVTAAEQLARTGYGTGDVVTRSGVGWRCAARIVRAARASMPEAPVVPSLPVVPPVVRPQPAPLPVWPELPDHVPPWIDPPEPRDVAPMPRLEPATRLPCCWPLGDPGTKSFRYCDDSTQRGSPYCAPHHKQAHIKRPFEAVA